MDTLQAVKQTNTFLASPTINCTSKTINWSKKVVR